MSKHNNNSKKALTKILFTSFVGATLIVIHGCVSLYSNARPQDSVSLTVHKGLSPTHDKMVRLKLHGCQMDALGACREDDLDEEAENDVSFFVVIENNTDFDLHIGSEAYSIGYYSLELDFEDNGQVQTARKKDNVLWYRNIPAEDVVLPGGIMLYPVTLTSEVWDYVPPVNIDTGGQASRLPDFRVRPRLLDVSLKRNHEDIWSGNLCGKWTRLNGELGESVAKLVKIAEP